MINVWKLYFNIKIFNLNYTLQNFNSVFYIQLFQRSRMGEVNPLKLYLVHVSTRPSFRWAKKTANSTEKY